MKLRTALIVTAFLSLVILSPSALAAGAAEFEDGSKMNSIERITYISFVGIGLVFIAAAFFLFMERNDVARRHRPAMASAS